MQRLLPQERPDARRPATGGCRVNRADPGERGPRTALLLTYVDGENQAHGDDACDFEWIRFRRRQRKRHLSTLAMTIPAGGSTNDRSHPTRLSSLANSPSSFFSSGMHEPQLVPALQATPISAGVRRFFSAIACSAAFFRPPKEASTDNLARQGRPVLFGSSMRFASSAFGFIISGSANWRGSLLALGQVISTGGAKKTQAPAYLRHQAGIAEDAHSWDRE